MILSCTRFKFIKYSIQMQGHFIHGVNESWDEQRVTNLSMQQGMLENM